MFNEFAKQILPEGKFSWELLIVDNNSTDATKAIVLEWKAKKLLPIKYVFEPRQGKSFALNHGIKESRGEFLVFTDDDIIPDQGWLSSLYEAAQNYPYNIIGGKVLPKMNQTLPDWLTFEKPYSVVLNGPLVCHDKGNEIREYGKGMWVPAGCNVLVRREMFSRHGLYSLDLGYLSPEVIISGEDSEIMFRFKNGGEKLLYYPKALVFHPADASRINKTRFRKWFWGAGRGRVRWNDTPANQVRWANVPKPVIKKTAKGIIKFLMALPSKNKAKKFFHELMLIHYAGLIHEYYIEGR